MTRLRKFTFKRSISLLSAAAVLGGLLSPIGSGAAVAYADEAPAASVFSNFITASGDQLMDGDQPFRFASLNYPGGMRDSDFSQEDALRTIAAIGGNVTRTYVPPVKRYDGANASYALILGPNDSGVMQFNEDGFKRLDHLLALANQIGVRLIIPFVDQWQWEGGIESYYAFRHPGTISGDAASDPDAWGFYTDPEVISDFKQVIHYMMNRVNTITGVKYKDDKAILAWETGNELGGYNQDKFPQAWTTEIADYVRNDENPSQLLLDGRFAVNNDSLSDPNVDIVGDHFYTGNFIDRINEDSAAAAGKKPYILGEFGLYTSGAPVDALYDAALKNGTDGIMIWSLRPHKDDGGFFWHDENPGNWASYHWPGFASGDYYGESDIIRTVYKYAHYMNAGDVAKTTAVPPIPAPANAPVLLGIDSVADIKWKGSVGASGYEVQRLPEGGTEWETVANGFSDGGRAGTPAFHDETALTGTAYDYRVRGVNESGASEWSNVVHVASAAHVITDEMSLLANDKEQRNVYAYDQSSNVLTGGGGEDGVGFKAYVATANPGYLTYASPVPLNSVSVTSAGSGTVKWFASATNGNYTEIHPAAQDGGVTTASDLPPGTRYVKFVIDGSNSVQIDRIQLTYAYDGTGYAAVPALTRNGFILDDSFSGKDAGKSENLSLQAAQPYTDNAPALGRTNGDAGAITYKTDGDIGSYRITSYSNVTDELKVYASADGDNYVQANPDVAKTPAGSGWSKVIYTDFALPAATKYLKFVYPATAAGAAPAIGRVEIGYGVNLIPLTDKPPANVFEDGEYDYGSDANVQARYERNVNGDDISIALDTANKNRGSYGVRVNYSLGSAYYAGLTQELGGVNLSAFDALHAWIKPDGSGNKLTFQLQTGDGRVWESTTPMTGTAGGTVELKLADFVQPQWNQDAAGAAEAIDLSSVSSFGIYVGGGDNASAASGAVYLDDVKLTNATKLDSFEGYGGYNALLNKAFSRNTGGGSFDLSLDKTHKSEGSYGLRVDYNFGGPGYAGGSFNPDFLNLKGYDGFSFWLQPDGSNNELAIQFTDASGKFWETKTVIRGTDPRLMYVPFDSFRYPSWYSGDTTARPDPKQNITAFSLYMGGGDSSLSTSGTLYFDDINGASFVDRLTDSAIAIDKSQTSVASLPYAISGTATGTPYVTLEAGKQVFYAPVQADGTWTYSTSKLPNGTVDIKASAQLYDGTVMSSDTYTVQVNVPNNPNTDGGGQPQQTNYLLDPGFEEAVDASAWPILPAHWMNKDADGNDVTDGIVKLEGGARTGAYKLVHWNNAPYEVTSSQRIDDLPDGIYELRAWTKSKGGQQTAEMFATVGNQEPLRTAIPAGESAWAYIKIQDIEVRGGGLTIGFHSKDVGDHWIGVDDVELVKTGDINYMSNAGLEDVVDAAAWPLLPVGWTHREANGNDVTDGTVKLEGEAHDGSYKLVHWNGSPYEVTSSTVVTNLPDGVYELSAWTKSKGGQEAAEMTAAVGADKHAVAIPAGEGQWANIKLSQLEVRGGSMTVSFHSKDAVGGNWIGVDDLALIRTGDLPTDPTDPTDPTGPTGPTGPTTPTTPSVPSAPQADVHNGIITIQPTKNAQGDAAASLREEDIRQALGQLSGRTLAIHLTGAEGAKAVQVDLPLQQFEANPEAEWITVDTGFAAVSIHRGALKNSAGAAASKMQLTVANVDPSTLPAEVRARLGGSAVYDFSLRLDGILVDRFQGNEVRVSLPYVLKPGEDPNHVVVYYIDDQNNLQSVKNGKYDPAAGKVEFSAKHFSKYAAAYVKVSFSDIAPLTWAVPGIESLAAKGILQGAGGSQFKPGQAVTRAEFITMLAAALDWTNEGSASSFKDVKAGAWYASAVAAAQKLGIVQGKTDGTFGINDPISRQDMAVMIYRAVKQQLPSVSAANAAAFSDGDAIGGYAAEAVQAVQGAGLMNGMPDGTFKPAGQATRAQAAVLVYRLLERFGS
ncbi:hypothetical protein GZH47_13730 [Paenibacillus rhizovicinus]|uniref:mannan endo-1,4-beta-mannosidase n=1 Tax=Paenibacillus rhizovicinus TaxID=2704463 RepID=A0A6C0NZX2_9BACL|nr:S-layer homology domain-containing protein [Paenibacillus rhizovicinus]QHW31794.1 hypothetical protein GZH47_13730 [Paenibacillus rhizovicinus]